MTSLKSFHCFWLLAPISRLRTLLKLFLDWKRNSVVSVCTPPFQWYAVHDVKRVNEQIFVDDLSVKYIVFLWLVFLSAVFSVLIIFTLL
jgi:hypothetical protein